MSTIIKSPSEATIQESSEATIQELKIGNVINVTTTGFKPFGVFCRCPNGYSGLIHISHITPKFVKDVNHYFTLNTVVQAEIIEINHDKKQIKLSTINQNLVEKKSSSAIDENGSGFGPVRDNVDNWFRKDDSN